MNNVGEKPVHYMLFPDLETVYAIQALLSPKEFIGYLKGNILKYRLRAGKKDDIKKEHNKIKDYENMLNEVMNEQQNQDAPSKTISRHVPEGESRVDRAMEDIHSAMDAYKEISSGEAGV